MTYYYAQILKLHSQLYSKEYLLQQLIDAKHFIDINFAEKINLDELAIKACLSKFHLIRSFKTLYGITPHQHLIAVRIRHAKQLLQNNKSIAEACVATGFESVTSFIGLFKKMTGYTPDLYRRKKQFSRVH
jgi:transcriptional regulator GlxA family with amidase domain